MIPVIQCANGALDEIWYFYDVKGSVQTGTFVATNPDGSKSNCPASGVKYLPKGSGTGTTTTTSAGTEPTSPLGTPFSGKGTMPVTTGGKVDGCIISGEHGTQRAPAHHLQLRPRAQALHLHRAKVNVRLATKY